MNWLRNRIMFKIVLNFNLVSPVLVTSHRFYDVVFVFCFILKLPHMISNVPMLTFVDTASNG